MNRTRQRTMRRHPAGQALAASQAPDPPLAVWGFRRWVFRTVRRAKDRAGR